MVVPNLITNRELNGASRCRASRLARGCCAVVLVLLVTGCECVEKHSFTYKLWNSEDLKKWSEPAPDCRLALYENPGQGEVFVQYDSLSDKRSTVTRRTYAIRENKERIAAGKKPRFLPGEIPAGMTAIPVLTGSPPQTNWPSPGLCASVSEDGRKFNLAGGDALQGEFELPIYREDGLALRVVGTPFAVVADATVGVFVAGIYGTIAWLEIGAPGIHH